MPSFFGKRDTVKSSQNMLKFCNTNRTGMLYTEVLFFLTTGKIKRPLLQNGPKNAETSVLVTSSAPFKYWNKRLTREALFLIYIQHNAIIELQRSPFGFNGGKQKFCFFPSVLGVTLHICIIETRVCMYMIHIYKHP